MPDRHDGALVLALDYGGTKLTGALTRFGEGTFHALERVVRPAGADGAFDRATMTALGERLLGGRRPAAVGVSFGGPVRFESGTVRLSHHVAHWEDWPLAAELSATFGAPCSADNDANAGALGEHRYGAGRGVDSLLYVTVSTGVGGGWIVGGRPWRGAEGMAGEFGHVTVDPDGPPCVCGGRGCVERLASGPNLAAHAVTLLQGRRDAGATLRRSPSYAVGALDARDVAAAAEAGDGIAIEALRAAASALGIALGSTANLMNPQRFVLGGGVTKSGAHFWDTLRRVAREHTMPEVTLDIVPAALGDEATLWGAVGLADDARRAAGAIA